MMSLNILDAYEMGTLVTKVMIPQFEIYFNDDKHFGIYSVIDEDDQAFSVKGTFVERLVVGQTYQIEGEVVGYKDEKQLSSIRTYQIKPVNTDGIIAYLQTLKGLKNRAYDIVELFGDESIDILIETPEKVAEAIGGIGKKTVTKWQKELKTLQVSQYAISTLLSYDIAPGQAKKLYDIYGDDILSLLETNPYLLMKEVRGYGFDRCDIIARQVGYQARGIERLMAGIEHVLKQISQEGHCFLFKDEVIERASQLLTIHLNEKDMEKLITNTQTLATTYETYGVQAEVNINDVKLYYDRCRREKSSYRKREHYYPVVSITAKDIAPILEQLIHKGTLTQEGQAIYLTTLYEKEKKIAEKVVDVSKDVRFKKQINLKKELSDYLDAREIILEEKQTEAVMTFAETKGGFFILSGSAGCGKTFTLKIILDMLQKQYDLNDKKKRMKIFAPTGKASKVASKATGFSCSTVHTGLGYTPEGFLYNESEPLPADILVLDESSMLDVNLMFDLMLAVRRGTKVIFMGDIQQLPSVGPGNILKDLIESEVVTVVTLDVVKRQQEKSTILLNANRIIEGKALVTESDNQDAFVLSYSNPQKVFQGVMASLKRLLDKGEVLEEIQILSPQKLGDVGTFRLNKEIQALTNPNEKDGPLNRMFYHQQKRVDLHFRKNDKVIHIRNNKDMLWYTYNEEAANYEEIEGVTGITNGECGIIADIRDVTTEEDDSFTQIVVAYDDGYVLYDETFQELDHAYALTIHKSQGSQWKNVIIPLSMQHFMMLDNNLFYTAYTRATDFIVVACESQALTKAIQTHRSRERHTRLAERLQTLAVTF